MITVKIYEYDDRYSVRAYLADDGVRFVAKDVCAILGIKNVWRELDKLGKIEYLNMKDVLNIEDFNGYLHTRKLFSVRCDKVGELIARCRNVDTQHKVNTLMCDIIDDLTNKDELDVFEDVDLWEVQQKLNKEFDKKLDDVIARLTKLEQTLAPRKPIVDWNHQLQDQYQRNATLQYLAGYTGIGGCK